METTVTDRPALDPMQLRAAFGQFPTGVTVITTCAADGRKVGLTANSFSSLSLDPPLVLWSLRKLAPSRPDFVAATHFAINVLAHDQIDLSRRFATPSADKFDGVLHVDSDSGGVPCLDGASARFVCRNVGHYEGGDHLLFIGEIEQFDAFGKAPLVFHAGQYRAIAGLAGHAPANAADLPAVNLGMTSFLDGMPPAGAGWYGTQYLQYYTAGRVNDNAGNKVGLPKQDIDLFAGLSQLVYQSPLTFAGMHPGLDVILPWIASARTDDGIGNVALNARAGFGDLLIGPFIQFDPVMGAQGPRFAQRVEFQFIVPTGAYDPSRAINPGSHFWSFDPYWAATLWLTPKWTVSWRLHYLWNATNHQPAKALGPDVTSTQAGQAIHVNFATEYEVRPGLRLGLNGYWLRQTTDMKVNGQDVPGSREAVFAIGPGAMYSFSPHDHLLFNAYFETHARNRPQGTRMVLRYVHHFQ